jgi:putative membrane protein
VNKIRKYGIPSLLFGLSGRSNPTPSRLCYTGKVTDVPVLNALIFAALGIIVFLVAFAILMKSAPFNLWRAIVEERNVAAAIFAGAVALGLCWIIAATMH